MSKVRKWSESYVSYGFTEVTPNGRNCAQCLHCSVVMSNASLRPSKLKNYRDKKHPRNKNDDIDALSAKRVRYDLEATLPHFGFGIKEKSILQCSYEVAYRIAKCKKPHTIAEQLIKMCARKMVEIIIGWGRKRKFSKFCCLMTLFADGLTTWLLMCASEFALKSRKACSRLAFNWTSVYHFLKAT